MMSRTTLRSILLIGTICIVGILLTQAYWVAKNYELKEKEMDLQVREILQNVAQGILLYNKNTSPLIDPVLQLQPDFFVTKVNDRIDPALLEGLLKREFLKRGLKMDLLYSIYDCQLKQTRQSGVVSFDESVKQYASKQAPNWQYNNYYFSLYLPTKDILLLSNLKLWILSTFILLLMVAFFSYLLYVVLHQRRLSEIQKDFINNMTHEFRTPLSTILLSSRAIKDTNIVEQPQRLSKYAAIIEVEALRLNHHVERVLQMAKLDVEHIYLKKEQVEMKGLIKEAVQTFQASFSDKPFQVDFVSDEQVILDVDRLHLLNVLLNLLDNALKYSPVEPAIHLRLSSNDQGAIVEIEDNGIGISQENQRKIFDKFYRVPNGLVHDVKGFGLGLNYVKHMVEAHKGYVEVRSEIKKGTTFRIFLPFRA